MSNRKNTMNNDMDSDKRRPTVPSDQQAVPTPPAPPAVSAFPERSDYIGNAVNDVPTQVSETGSETEDVAVPRSRVVSRVLLAVITVIVLVALIVAVVLLPLPAGLSIPPRPVMPPPRSKSTRLILPITALRAWRFPTMRNMVTALSKPRKAI